MASKIAPRGHTQDSQDSPKRSPRGPQEGPREPQEGPRGPQEGPKRPQKAPRWPQDGPMMVPRGPRKAPKRTPSGPKRPPRGTQDATESLRTAMRPPRRPKRLPTKKNAKALPQEAPRGNQETFGNFARPPHPAPTFLVRLLLFFILLLIIIIILFIFLPATPSSIHLASSVSSSSFARIGCPLFAPALPHLNSLGHRFWMGCMMGIREASTISGRPHQWLQGRPSKSTPLQS